MSRRYSRRFGVEFEFVCSWETLKYYASKAIRKVYGNNKYYSRKDRFDSDFKLDKWHIKEESGCVSELTTPVSTLRDVPKICSVIELLNNDKVKPQEDCGMHVHVDVHDIDQYHIMSGWLTCERSIISCFSRERRVSGFCEKMIESHRTSRNLVAKLLEDRTESSSHGDAISLTEYQERKTVEIRLSEGTLDVSWVRSWITFLMHWFEYLRKKNPSRLACEKCNSVSLEEMIEDMKLDKKTLQIIRERYEKFHKNPYWT